MVSEAAKKFAAKWDEISGATIEEDYYISSFFVVGNAEKIKEALETGKYGNTKVTKTDQVKNRKFSVIKSITKNYTYKHDPKRLKALGNAKDDVFCIDFDGSHFNEDWMEDMIAAIGKVEKIEKWRVEGDFNLKDGSVFHDFIDLLVLIDATGDCAAITSHDDDNERHKKRQQEVGNEEDPEIVELMADENKELEETLKDVKFELKKVIVVEDIDQAGSSTFDPFAW